MQAPSLFRDRILPVLTVLLAILVIWHVMVVYLNAPFVRDQAARAGETVTMKHIIRTETSAGLAALRDAALPTRVKITHEGSGQEFTLPLQWRGVRSAESSWPIPAAAKLGVYTVVLEHESESAQHRRSVGSGRSGLGTRCTGAGPPACRPGRDHTPIVLAPRGPN